jgi:hypothetical protein
VLSAPPCVQLAYSFELSGFKGIGPEDRPALALALFAWTGVSALLSLLSAAAGLRAVLAGTRLRQPVALGLLGGLLGLVAFGLWAAASVICFNTVSPRL